MTTDNAGYYMLANEWAWSVTSLLIKTRSGHGFSFGVRAWTEMEIWCIKGMCRLKVLSSEKNGYKRLT